MKILWNKEGDQGGGAAGGASTETTVNMDALVEPEGTEPMPGAGGGDGGAGGSTGGDAGGGAPPPKKDEGTAKPAADAGGAAGGGDAGKGGDGGATDPYFKQFYKKLIDSIELPADFKPAELTEENFFDEITGLILKNADFSGAFHPGVMKLQELTELHNGDLNAALKDYTSTSSWKAMTDEQLIEWDLTKNLDVPADKVKEMMEGMNTKVEGLRIRKALERNEANALDSRAKELKQLREQEIRQQQEEFEKDLAATVAKVKEKSESWGVPLDAKQKAELPELVKSYVTPGEDGVPPIAKLLSDNDILTDVIINLHYKGKHVKDFLDVEKNKVKQSYKDKLDPDPKHTDKSVTHVETNVDLNALSEPEQNY